eukprot:XP_011674834.1 PREDICTED: uncharacterized protein LOC105443415 [Strongylocentrotus purpuratus]
MASVTTDMCSAVLLAVSDSKEKLLRKRNKFCSGDSLKTDTDTGSGRGKRKRRPRKAWTSEESMSESEDDIGVITTQKNTKKTKTKDIVHCSKLATELRKKLEDPVIIKPCQEVFRPSSPLSDLDLDLEEGGTIQQLRRQLAQERMDKEKLKEKLKETLSFVKEIPKLMERMDNFMTDMEPLRAKIKKSRQPQLPTSPPSSLPDSEGLALCMSPSTSAVREAPIDKVQVGPHVTLTKRTLLNCNHLDVGKLTSDLMVAVFGREGLLNSSLTGGKNKEGKSKPPLDHEKVADIIGNYSYCSVKLIDLHLMKI